VKALLVIAVLATYARADTQTRAVVDGKGTAVRLVSTWSQRSKLEVDGKLVYSGEAVGTVTAGHGFVVVAYATGGDKPFRVRTLENGKLHDPLAFARPGKRKDVPFAIAATATPDGFAIFYQEVQTDDPTAAHTYLCLLDGQGEVAQPPKEISVPWALADAIWDGDGYHLALIYAGGGDGMRLSMVHATKDGVPQGHPDWASAPGIVTDVHLARAGDRVRAFYRGGAAGDRLIETDVTQIGQWGRVTSPSKDRGALAAAAVLAVNAKGEAIRLR
jgi:hypothetical protein